MNKVSMIINGVRYDSVDNNTGFCNDCDLLDMCKSHCNLSLCEYLGVNYGYVFKKTNSNQGKHKRIRALKYDMDGKFCGEYVSKSSALRTFTRSKGVGWGVYRNGYILFKKLSNDYPLEIEPFSVLSNKQLKDYYVPASELLDLEIHKSCLDNSKLPSVDRKKLCINGKYTNIKHRFTVYQYSLDGDLLESYDSIRDAAKSTNIRYSQIYNCLTGLTHKAGGYVWKKEGTELGV